VITEDQTSHLRRAIALAHAARASGELPFGAVITGAAITTLVEATSTEISTGDWTCHAETNAVRVAVRLYTRTALATSTIFASAEPCAMCAAAIYYAGIRRVIYGFPEPRLRALLGTVPAAAGLGISCRRIFAATLVPMEIIGPVLEDEAALPHQGYWTEGGER
jgi:tRNA(Arg) A34 adenosine deaminase TadA